MSQATTNQMKDRICRIIPLDEQIEIVKAKIEQEAVYVEHLNMDNGHKAKLNFWSNVLRQLETLKSQSK